MSHTIQNFEELEKIGEAELQAISEELEKIRPEEL